MYSLFILLLPLPEEGISCSFLSQLSFTSATGLLKRSDINIILAKLTSNEGSSPFWSLTIFGVHQSTYIPCTKKELLLSLFSTATKVNPLGAVTQPGNIRKQTMFRIPFLILSPCGVSRVAPKEDCSDMGATTELLFCSQLQEQSDCNLTPTAYVLVHN